MSYFVHITPSFPPAIGGVGEYAHCLAGALNRSGYYNKFIVDKTVRNITEHSERKPASRLLRERSGAELFEGLTRLDAKVSLLHFSSYGYARWGLCFWLTEGLARWKSADPDRRLVVMFHELYASGPPWRASFYTSFPQRRNARRLAALADHVVCGYQLIGDRLKAWLPSRRVDVLPVFSNVGETGRRGQGRADVEALGILPAAEVSRHLAAARLGLADYPRQVAAKSGILAAYHAHGLLAFNFTDRGAPMDGLVEGEHYLGLRTMRSADLDPETIAANGHRWYRRHDRARAAALFAGLLHESSGT